MGDVVTQNNGLVFWTDVVTVPSLRFNDQPQLEQQFQAQYRQRRTSVAALGSLAEGSLNIIMAAKALAPHFKNLHATPLCAHRIQYALGMVAILPLIRGAPYALWVWNKPLLTRWYIPVCVVTRLLSVVVYALHNIAYVQMFGMVVPYEYITGIPMDMLTNLVVSSLVKQLPFALHVPLSLLECGTVAYVLASQSGMCGATDALTHAIPCPVVDPVASVDTARKLPFPPSYVFSRIPCPGTLGRPAWLAWAADSLQRLVIRTPPGAYCLRGCMEITQHNDVDRANALASRLTNVTNHIWQWIMWLGHGIPLRQTSKINHAGTTLSACASLAVLVTVCTSMAIAAWLFFHEALERCSMWQQHHRHVMLQPPYVHLRRLLRVQLWVVGVAVLLGLSSLVVR